MNDRVFQFRIKGRWLRLAGLAIAAALVVAPIAAYASHSFTDVPTGHTFHSDIEWLKDTGVTKGCNPPSNTKYCPNDNVTRGQMAAFMRRLANDVLFGDVAYDSSIGNVSFAGFTVVEVKSVTVTAPQGIGGVVIAEAHGNILGSGTTVSDDHLFRCWITTEQLGLGTGSAQVSVPVGTFIGGLFVFSRPFGTSHAEALGPGQSKTFYLNCFDSAGGDTTNLFRVTDSQLYATFTPGDTHSVITPP